MEQLQTMTSAIALSMGAAWASGINLYATIFMLGWMGNSGTMALPETLQLTQEPLVMGAAALMYCVEFFADKMPGVDTGWDAIHTFIRIPAGAALAAAAVGEVDPGIALAAALVGGAITTATHATKAGARVLINASPEPVSNWVTSVGEDVAVIGGVWTALHFPVVFLCFLVFFLVMLVWLLPKIWRGILLLFTKLWRWVSGQGRVPVTSPPAPASAAEGIIEAEVIERLEGPAAPQPPPPPR